NKISDCPERPDSKSRIAAAGDKDKAKTLACRMQRLSCWTGRRKKKSFSLFAHSRINSYLCYGLL
uniref:hypothetical protein n=1 Tax=Alistipes shahii TaxID=328814 RepID=UPI0040276114